MQIAKLVMLLFVISVVLWVITIIILIIYPLIAIYFSLNIISEVYFPSLLSILFGGILFIVILWITVIRFVLRRFDNEIYEEAIRSKNFDEAIKFCEKKIDFSFKKDAEAWNQLVDVYFLKGDSEKVIYTLKNMMEIKMKNNQAFKRLLDYYLSEADYNNAVEMCSQYLEIYPNTSIIPYSLDQIYQKFSKVDEITKHFKKLINLADRYLTHFPNKHELIYLIAKIYEEQGEFEKSLERINNALQIRFTNLVYQKYKEDLLLRLENIEKDLNKNSLTSD